MKVFIDCGAYDGDSIEQFYNWFKLIDDPNEYSVYAFEPNPYVMSKAKERLKGRDIVFYEDAVWIENETKEFSVHDVGSTLQKSKNTWDAGEKIEVSTIDFSKWIEPFKNDYVVVKMDIEGSEFEVLRKMIKDKTIFIPDILMVEFHPNKVSDYTTEDKDDLIKEVSKYTRIIEWH